MNISQAAKAAGVSVRTLHYYDEIGLLHPTRVTAAGYRLYAEKELAKLGQIMFYRELGFALADIADILSRPDYDMCATLQKHRCLLKAKQQQITQMLQLVDDTLKGETTMKQNDAANVAALKEQYAAEVKERWGKTPAYAESEAKCAARSDAENTAVEAGANALFAAFAACVPHGAESEKAQQLCAQWQAYITQHYYQCTKQILNGLAEMYVGDERFTANLDTFGPGTAQLMHDALKIYCAE